MHGMNGPMERRPLGSTGLTVSLLGLGAERIGRVKFSKDRALDLLRALEGEGVTLVDTAAPYAYSESYIGEALAGKRDRFVIVTKCGWVNDYEPAWTPAQMTASVDQSLQRMRTDHVDVLLLHSCPVETLQRQEIRRVLDDARRSGKARFTGYSGDNEALALAIEFPETQVIQATLNMLDLANAPTIERARSRGIGVLAKRPVAGGVPGSATAPRSAYDAQYWSRWIESGLKDIDPASLDSSLAALAPASLWAHVAPRFTAHAPGVDALLVGTTNLDRLRFNAAALASGPLSADLHNEIEQRVRVAGLHWPALG